jgi:hypothetical protein
MSATRASSLPPPRSKLLIVNFVHPGGRKRFIPSPAAWTATPGSPSAAKSAIALALCPFSMTLGSITVRVKVAKGEGASEP